MSSSADVCGERTGWCMYSGLIGGRGRRRSRCRRRIGVRGTTEWLWGRRLMVGGDGYAGIGDDGGGGKGGEDVGEEDGSVRGVGGVWGSGGVVGGLGEGIRRVVGGGEEAEAEFGTGAEAVDEL